MCAAVSQIRESQDDLKSTMSKAVLVFEHYDFDRVALLR
ncbi:hypothetical protein J2S36_001533 [Arcanobacterium hippocoleae]|uniref:Uncharacterized protein n=1 Tax=Arcanobacterium hippocoleae TaxID=149017 RepID=A0ABU1T565_9ACTO|nr:hypothetical protein [Arcanobacterium hippocoleae]